MVFLLTPTIYPLGSHTPMATALAIKWPPFLRLSPLVLCGSHRMALCQILGVDNVTGFSCFLDAPSAVDDFFVSQTSVHLGIYLSMPLQVSDNG